MEISFEELMGGISAIICVIGLLVVLFYLIFKLANTMKSESIAKTALYKSAYSRELYYLRTKGDENGK